MNTVHVDTDIEGSRIEVVLAKPVDKSDPRYQATHSKTSNSGNPTASTKNLEGTNLISGLSINPNIALNLGQLAGLTGPALQTLSTMNPLTAGVSVPMGLPGVSGLTLGNLGIPGTVPLVPQGGTMLPQQMAYIDPYLTAAAMASLSCLNGASNIPQVLQATSPFRLAPANSTSIDNAGSSLQGPICSPTNSRASLRAGRATQYAGRSANASSRPYASTVSAAGQAFGRRDALHNRSHTMVLTILEHNHFLQMLRIVT